VIGLQGRVPNTSASNWFQCWMVLFTKEYIAKCKLNSTLTRINSWIYIKLSILHTSQIKIVQAWTMNSSNESWNIIAKQLLYQILLRYNFVNIYNFCLVSTYKFWLFFIYSLQEDMNNCESDHESQVPVRFIYLLTHLLITWSSVLEELTGSQLVK